MFGLFRQFETYAEGGPLRFRAFRTVAEALAWLELDASVLGIIPPDAPDDGVTRAAG